MTHLSRHRDGWRWPAFLLWLAIFGAGLFPEQVYWFFRDAGSVTTQRALINSPFLLYFALTAFLGGFVFLRCQQTCHNNDEALGKAVQVCVLALVAFLPLQLEQLHDYFNIPARDSRNFILFMVFLKCLVWLYLLGMICRYHFWSGYRVFRRMPSIFLRTHESSEDTCEQTMPSDNNSPKNSGEGAPALRDEDTHEPQS